MITKKKQKINISITGVTF